MKLYLADEEKLNSYSLPEKPEESFLFSYISSLTNIEVFFNIYANDNEWYIKNNDDFVINDTNTDMKLEVFKYYKIKIKGVQENLYLYTYPTYNDNYKDIVTENINKITIGKEQNNSIVYQNQITKGSHVSITSENNLYYIETINNENDKNIKTNAYLNSRIINKKTLLNFGDVIFINNLKIIWMNGFIRTFDTMENVLFANNLIITSSNIVDNSQYLKYDMKENNIE